MSVQQLPKGDEANLIARLIEDSRTSYRALDSRREELLRTHEGEWVASYHGSFVFGSRLEDAIAKAGRQGWPVGQIAIEQLRRERADVLL